jgi:hypothetical protein
MTRELAIDEATMLPLRTSIGTPRYFWRILGLRRWPLKTAYTEVVKRLVITARRPDINPVPRVVVDMTGVGASVFEQVRTALDPYGIDTFGISISAGEKWAASGRNTFTVSKVQIVSCLAEALGSERVYVCQRADGSPMENQRVLESELAAFRIKTTKTGYQTAEAFNSDHDDCVISISLPLWLGSQRFCEMRQRTDSPDVVLRPHERAALSAEQRKIEQDEQTAIERERQQAEIERKRRLRPSWAAKERTDEERQRDPLNPKWWTS